MNLQTESPDYNIYLAGGRTFLPPENPLIIPPVETSVYFFVQFKKSLTLEERKQLQDQHRLHFNRYIPNFAFLELLNFEQWNGLSQDPLYRAIARYLPRHKISPRLSSGESSPGDVIAPAGLPVRVILFFETDDETLKRIIEKIISLRAPHLDELRNRLPKQKASRRSKRVAEALAPDQIKILDNRKIGGDLQLLFLLTTADVLPPIAEIESVQSIEEVVSPQSDLGITVEDFCPEKNYVAGTVQSGTPGVTPLWRNNLNGSQQIIGIVDEFGSDVTHCMFSDASGTTIGQSHRKIVGLRNTSTKVANHATLVAGIAAGDQVDLSGNGESRGIAWAAKLSLDDLQAVKNHQETILDLYHRQALEGAAIHSNSWHEDVTDYNETARYADSFTYGNEENLICASTANSRNNEVLGPPGTAKNSLCISAGGQHPHHLDHKDGRSGPTGDMRRKPDICAPGCYIHSASKSTGCLCTKTDCATSWATPVMAGAAALARQYYLEGFYPTGTRNAINVHRASAALIKATLLNSTVLMENKTQYPDGRTSWGLIQLNNALFLSGAPRRLFMIDVRNNAGLSTGQSQTHSVSVVSDSEILKITLAWTDPPAELVAGIALINDLDLVVRTPGGTEIYRGNMNFVGGFSRPQPAAVSDNRNNVEMVIVSNPTPGLWTVTVEGTAVNIGLQGYALVVTGALT